MPSLVPGCASGLNGRAYGEGGQQTPTVLGAKIKIENTLKSRGPGKDRPTTTDLLRKVIVRTLPQDAHRKGGGLRPPPRAQTSSRMLAL